MCLRGMLMVTFTFLLAGCMWSSSHTHTHFTPDIWLSVTITRKQKLGYTPGSLDVLDERCTTYLFSLTGNKQRFEVDVFHSESVYIIHSIKRVSQTQQSDIRNNTILHKKGYMFRLYLSHLQALKGQIHDLEMTQVESKYVALLM
jgi:hypothetical protein